MDLGIIIAIVGSAVAIIGVTITMLLWVRGESRTDWRNLQDQIIADRRELIEVCRRMDIEMKDFHYRLLEIERTRKV